MYRRSKWPPASTIHGPYLVCNEVNRYSTTARIHICNAVCMDDDDCFCPHPRLQCRWTAINNDGINSQRRLYTWMMIALSHLHVSGIFGQWRILQFLFCHGAEWNLIIWCIRYVDLKLKTLIRPNVNEAKCWPSHVQDQHWAEKPAGRTKQSSSYCWTWAYEFLHLRGNIPQLYPAECHERIGPWWCKRKGGGSTKLMELTKREFVTHKKQDCDNRCMIAWPNNKNKNHESWFMIIILLLSSKWTRSGDATTRELEKTCKR